MFRLYRYSFYDNSREQYVNVLKYHSFTINYGNFTSEIFEIYCVIKLKTNFLRKLNTTMDLLYSIMKYLYRLRSRRTTIYFVQLPRHSRNISSNHHYETIEITNYYDDVESIRLDIIYLECSYDRPNSPRLESDELLYSPTDSLTRYIIYNT